PALAAAGGWAMNGPSAVRLITPWRVARAAATEIRLGLHFRLRPGWHVYWKNSGDAGYPPTASFSGRGLAGAEILWPAPRRFELPGGLVAFGYEREVVYPVRARLRAAAIASHEPLQWTADVDYLVCQVDCIPYRSALGVTQPVGEPRPDPETAPLIAAWWKRLPQPAESLPEVAAETAFESGGGGQALALTVRLRGVAADPLGSDLFLETNDQFDCGRPRVESIPGGMSFRVPLSRRQATLLPPATTFAWTVTGLARIGRPMETLSVEARRTVALEAALPPSGIARPLAAFARGPRAASLLIALAFLSTHLALGLWGLMEIPLLPRKGHKDLRTALGFAACAGTVWLLYALSLVVGAERLALVELALLVLAL